MRRAAAVDVNQKAIVALCRGMGATVQHLHQVGRGCPDLLVGYRGQNWLLEVKDGALPPSRRKLTPDEERWRREWRGAMVHVIECPEDVLRLLGSI